MQACLYRVGVAHSVGLAWMPASALMQWGKMAERLQQTETGGPYKKQWGPKQR